MRPKVVAMARIPWCWKENTRRPSNVAYSRFSELTWRWWCRKKGIEFVSIDEPLGSKEVRDLPPTFQRWFALQTLLSQYGRDAQIAIVDADTMIRWDTPDFFDLADTEFAAVRDPFSTWTYASIRAYQHLFPDVFVPWWDYFNTGLVVLNAKHRELTQTLIEFVLHHDTELAQISNPWGYGDDQTLLNFILRQRRIPILFLEATYNIMHCVTFTPEISKLERMQQSPQALGFSLFNAVPEFVGMGYIWHFNNIRKSQSFVMRDTWTHICDHYPGAD